MRQWKPTFELLEARRLLAVTANFAAGTLTVSSDASDNIAITVAGGDVKINGADPGGGAVAANTITSLQINGFTNDGDNEIDLTGLNPAFFTALATVNVDASGGTDSIVLGTAVTTTGAQTYTNPVVLAADTTLTSSGGGDIQLLSTVDGDGVLARSLTVNTSGSTEFGDGGADYIGSNEALSSVGTDAGGQTVFHMQDTASLTVNTIDDQVYADAVVLAGDAHLSGQQLLFLDTINSADATARALTLDSSGGGFTGFSDNVGTTFRLASLTTNADGSVLLADGISIATTGAQSYGDDVLLQANGATFDAGTGTVTFNDAVTGANVAVVTASTLTINAGGADNVFTVGDVLGVRTVQLDANTTLTTVGVNAISLTGGGGDDVLDLDYTNTNVVPAGGLTFDGGPQGVAGDRINVIGSGNTATYTPDAAVPGDGVITVDGNSITFVGLEPVDMSGMALVTITLPGANDVLDIANGFDFATGAVPALRVSGTSSGVAIETIALSNNTAVVIDTTTVDGDDTITITSADNAHGNASLTIDTGAGTDVVNVNGAATVTGDLTIDSQHINVNALVTATNVTLDAGAGSIGDGNAAANNIAATDLSATAGTGIDLDTAVDTVTADVTGTGDIDLSDTDAVTLTSITTADGNIIATSFGEMLATLVNAGGAGRNVHLTTVAGNLRVDAVSAAGDQVELDAAGAIVDENAAASNVTAANLDAAAAGGIDLDTAVDTVTADVTGTGDIDLSDTDAVTLTSITTADGSISATSFGEMLATLVNAGGAARNVHLTTVSGDLRVDDVSAADDQVQLDAAGAIVDENGAANNVTAANLDATAGTGIDLDTTVDTITAAVTGTGNIDLNDVDAVTLTSVTTADGSIDVTSGGTLSATLVNAGGVGNNIALTATTGDLAVGSVMAAGDTISLNAAGSITDSNGATINVTASLLLAQAGTGIDLDTDVDGINAEVTGTGGINLNEADDVLLTSIVTNDGNIDVTSGGNQTASTVTTGGAGTNVNLTTTAGDILARAITAAGDTITLAAAGAIVDDNGATNNITAATLDATASTGIDLDTTVDDITADVTGTGDIDLNEADAVALTSVTTADGNVDVVSGGEQTANFIVAGGAGNDIALTTTAGNLNVGLVSANADMVTLVAAGAIVDNNAAANNVAADSLDATAASGIELDTDVFTITASVTGIGDIVLREANSVILTSLTTADGSISVTAGGMLTATLVVAGGTDRDVNLETTAGDIDVGVISADTDDVILLANDAITDGNGAANNITAANLDATAGDSIELDTTVDMITAVTGAGDIEIDEADAVTLDGVGAADGNVTITSGGQMTATLVVAAGTDRDLRLTTTAGDLLVNQVGAEDDDVFLVAAGGIVDNNGTDNNVTSAFLDAMAVTGIDLDTMVDEIVANVTGTGDIELNEANAVTLTTVTTANGDVSVTSGGQMTANFVVATNAGSNLDLTTTAGDLLAGQITANADVVTLNVAGAIVDNNGAANNITSSAFNATAGGGIELDTDVATIDAATTATGDVVLRELDAVTLNSVTTFDGNVTVTAGGDLRVGAVTATGNDVQLTTAGAIVDDNGAALNVTATTLIAEAAGGIELDTAVASVTAASTGTGGVILRETDAITLSSITTADGLIDVSSGGTMNASFVVSGGAGNNISLATTAGGIAAGLISANADRIDLTAATNITDGNDAGNNFDAASAVLTADTGIASLTAALEATLGRLEAVTRTGFIAIANTGALVIGGISPLNGVSTTQDGGIFVSTDNSLVVVEDVVASGDNSLFLLVRESPGSGDDLIVDAGASISAGAEVALSAGDDVRLFQGSDITAVDEVTITGDAGDNDPEGTQIDLRGTITAASVALNGGPNDDLVSFFENVADQFNTSDNATGAHGNVAFTFSGLAPTDVGFHFEGGAGNDALSFTFSLPHEVAYFADENEPNSGVINVRDEFTLSFDGLEPLFFNGAGGSLTVDATSEGTVSELTLSDGGAAGPTDGISVVAGNGGLETTTFSGFDSLIARSGNSNEIFTLFDVDASDPAGPGVPLTSIVFDGRATNGVDAGFDQFLIRSLPASIALSIISGDGTDFVDVSSMAPATGGTTAGINGPIDVDAGPGNDRLRVSDAGGTTGKMANLTSTQLTGMGLGSGITYSGITLFDLLFGSGDDELTVNLPLPSPVEPALPEAFRISGGANGADKLEIIGTNNPNVLDVAIVGVLGSGAQFQIGDIEILHMFGFAGPDQFTNNTAVPSFLVGGEGSDTLRGGSAVDIIFGGAGIDQLFGNDADDFLYPDHDIIGGQIVEQIVNGDLANGGGGFDSVVALGFGDIVQAINQLLDTGSAADVITWLRGQFVPDSPAQRQALLLAGLAGVNPESVADPSAVPPPPPPGDLTGVSFAPDQYVERAYADYLERDPNADPAGVQAFTQLVIGGLSIENMRAIILGSDEYFGKNGNTTPRGFVENLFVDVFNRVATPGEAGGFTNLLLSGTSRDQLAQFLLTQPAAREVQIDEIFEQQDGIPLNGAPVPPGQLDIDRLAMRADFRAGGTIRSIDQALRTALANGRQYADFGVSPSATFVRSLFQNQLILGREPTTGELQTLLGQLGSGNQDRKIIAFNLLTSPERRARLIQFAYLRLLDRATDGFGLNAFLNLLATGGRVEDVEVALLGSEEYFQQQGSTAAGFVAALYQDVLGRAGSAGEINNFVNLINGGTSRAAIASIFVNSTEARTNLINGFAQGLLGRPATPTEQAQLLTAFANGENQDQVMLRLILNAGFGSL